MAKISLKSFLQNNRYNELFDVIKEHYERLDSNYEVCDFNIDKIYINDEGYRLDVWLSIDVEYRYFSGEKIKKIYMSLKVSPGKDYNDIHVYNIEHDYYKQPLTLSLNDDLVPYINKNELDAVANAFLLRYYPEALTAPTPIEAVKLAERLGLEVLERTITTDNSVFGQITFRDTELELFDDESGTIKKELIKGGTICVDPDVYFLRSYGAVQNTIVHECIHWELHKKTFDLGYLQDNDTTKMVCQVIGGSKVKIKGCDTTFIEWQANALAPRIQMPKEMFNKKAQEFLDDYSRVCVSTHTVEAFPCVITALANFFNVSKLAAKIRLYEIGYYQVAGACEYIDGEYVRPYAFKKDAISKKQTYSIGCLDVITQYALNPVFKAALDSSSFVYVEKHVCLNTPKYVCTNKYGDFVLTDYARYHMDECCLAFELEPNGKVHYYGFAKNY